MNELISGSRQAQCVGCGITAAEVAEPMIWRELGDDAAGHPRDPEAVCSDCLEAACDSCGVLDPSGHPDLDGVICGACYEPISEAEATAWENEARERERPYYNLTCFMGKCEAPAHWAAYKLVATDDGTPMWASLLRICAAHARAMIDDDAKCEVKIVGPFFDTDRSSQNAVFASHGGG